MPWNDNSSGGGGGRKNPWGQGPRPGPGGGGGNGRGGPEQPDIDEALRRFQQSLREMLPNNFGPGKALGLIAIVIIGLWLASGFYVVEPGQHAVVKRFGDWDRTKTQEGLGYHAPWPVESDTHVEVDEVRRLEIGFRQQMSGRTGGSPNSEQKRDVPEESLMLTSDANIINLDMVVLWNVKSAENFLFNIRDPEGTLKKVAESAIREVVGQTRMFPIITKERAEVANKARQIMVENLNQYDSGVNITQVLIQEAEVHPDVQDAFQDVQSARQDALNTENEAQAYREDILPKARGDASKLLEKARAYKQAQVEKARGEAERFDKIFAAYKEGETVTRTRMYLETMEEVLSNSSKIVLDQSGSGGKGQGVVPYLPLNEIRPASGQAKRNRTGN